MGIFKKGENWFIDYRVNGRRKREQIGPNRKLAEDVLHKRKIEIAENKYLDLKKEPKIGFPELGEKFLALHSIPNKRSARRDEGIIKIFKNYFGNKEMRNIDILSVEQYKAERAKSVAPATVNKELALLKTMFNKAIEWKCVTQNPLKSIKLFKLNNARVRFLTPDEFQRLMKYLYPRMKAITTILVNTGMRKGELTNLRWKDVNFPARQAKLIHTKNSETRFIELNDEAYSAFLWLKEHSIESEYVMVNPRTNKPFDYRKAFETAIEKAKIEDFRPHDLRHTFASYLVMNGVDLNTVRELLGHKSLAMTLRYAHLSPQHKKEAVSKLRFAGGHFLDTKPEISKVLKFSDFATIDK